MVNVSEVSLLNSNMAFAIPNCTANLLPVIFMMFVIGIQIWLTCIVYQIAGSD
jgi:hypothetical protein